MLFFPVLIPLAVKVNSDVCGLTRCCDNFKCFAIDKRANSAWRKEICSSCKSILMKGDCLNASVKLELKCKMSVSDLYMLWNLQYLTIIYDFQRLKIYVHNYLKSNFLSKFVAIFNFFRSYKVRTIVRSKRDCWRLKIFCGWSF